MKNKKMMKVFSFLILAVFIFANTACPLPYEKSISTLRPPLLLDRQHGKDKAIQDRAEKLFKKFNAREDEDKEPVDAKSLSFFIRGLKGEDLVRVALWLGDYSADYSDKVISIILKSKSRALTQAEFNGFLLSMLDSDNIVLRAQAVRVAGKLGIAGAIPKLMQALKRDRRPFGLHKISVENNKLQAEINSSGKDDPGREKLSAIYSLSNKRQERITEEVRRNLDLDLLLLEALEKLAVKEPESRTDIAKALIGIASDTTTRSERFYWVRSNAIHRLKLFGDMSEVIVLLDALLDPHAKKDDKKWPGYIPKYESGEGMAPFASPIEFGTSPSYSPVFDLTYDAGFARQGIECYDIKRKIESAKNKDEIAVIFKSSKYKLAAFMAAQEILNNGENEIALKSRVLKALGECGDSAIILLDLLGKIARDDTQDKQVRRISCATIADICEAVLVQKLRNSELKKDLKDAYEQRIRDSRQMLQIDDGIGPTLVLFNMTRGLLGNLYRLGEINDLNDMLLQSRDPSIVTLSGGGGTQGLENALETKNFYELEDDMLIQPLLGPDDDGGSTKAGRALDLILLKLTTVASGDMNKSIKMQSWMKDLMGERFRESLFKGKSLFEAIFSIKLVLDKTKGWIEVKDGGGKTMMEYYKDRAINEGGLSEYEFSLWRSEIEKEAKLIDEFFIRPGYMGIQRNTVQNFISKACMIEAQGIEIIKDVNGNIVEGHLNPYGVKAGILLYKKLVTPGKKKQYDIEPMPSNMVGNVLIAWSRNGVPMITQDLISHCPLAGEYNRVEKVEYLYPEFNVEGLDIDKIRNAKIILIGMTSFVTSLSPLLLQPAVKKALMEAKQAITIFVVTPVGDREENKGLTFREMWKRLLQFLPEPAIKDAAAGSIEPGYIIRSVVYNDPGMKSDVELARGEEPLEKSDFFTGSYSGPIYPTPSDLQYLLRFGVEPFPGNFMRKTMQTSRTTGRPEPVLLADSKALGRLISKPVRRISFLWEGTELFATEYRRTNRAL